MTTSKTSGKGLPSSATVDFEVKPPFQIMEDNRRRFIRIDFEEPICYTTLKNTDGAFWPDGDGPSGKGEILNISAGGFLMFTDEPVMENSLLSMSIKIEGCEEVNNILGLVKRTDIDSGGYLIGIESITREKLFDIMSSQEIEQIPSDVASFTERLRALLNTYIYAKKLSVEENAKRNM